ncbi:MAG: cardiolipin synthase [Deltaproteobacteria bacterium]|nr:cardiolipin synthase [Deltaproteobacteria bacterium]
MEYTVLLVSFISYLALAVVWILLEKKRPTSTLAWILVLVFIPFFGMLLYLLIGRHRAKKEVRLRAASFAQLAPTLSEAAAFDKGLAPFLPGPGDGRYLPVVELSRNIGYAPITHGNKVEIFLDGVAKHQALFNAVRNAQRFVHLEYYIFQPDDTGMQLMDILKDKARHGIEVRLLVDGVGSYALCQDYLEELEEAGVETGIFHPLPVAIWKNRINYRNHRKIAVIDGRTGFLGGMNIGDEYMAGKSGELPWRDTHLSVKGPAVWGLQRIFSEDWHLATGKVLAHADYFPRPMEMGSDLVQIMASGPDMNWSAIHYLYFTAISTAEKNVRITTPYFVPDEPLLLALRTSSLRGIDVEILVPGKTDLPLVTFAGRSYYEDLLDVGVKIHEYQPRVLHAKVLTVDQRFAGLGSANMDIRSFQLNYEVGAFVHSKERAGQLDKQFEKDLLESKEVNLDAWNNRGFSRKLIESSARLLSPLL